MHIPTEHKHKYCGHVAIIGRPNVGKSTLLNHILGQKISITSRKPQTTRHQILGINTVDNRQIIYVDTPGLHGTAKRALNRYMNRVAKAVLFDVNVVVWVIEALRWTKDDELVLDKVKHVEVPLILVVNQVDKIADKSELLPFIAELQTKAQFADIIPLSAKTGDNVEKLEQVITHYLPQADQFLYPEDEITDRSERFLAAEIIREKLMRSLGQEVPYSATVEIEQFKVEDRLLRISALIWVERAGQKIIIIGEKGQGLKQIGTQARQDMEALFERKVFLQLWVKIRDNWADDERALHSLGYD